MSSEGPAVSWSWTVGDRLEDDGVVGGDVDGVLLLARAVVDHREAVGTGEKLHADLAAGSVADRVPTARVVGGRCRCRSGFRRCP